MGCYPGGAAVSAPERIWLPAEHAEDAARADNGYGMTPYILVTAHEAAVAAARAEGIDAVETEVREWLAAPSLPGNEQAAIYDQACHDILRYIVALKVRP